MISFLTNRHLPFIECLKLQVPKMPKVMVRLRRSNFRQRDPCLDELDSAKTV